MDARSLGEAGLNGWRGVVGPRLAGALAKRTRMTEADARAAIGLAYLALTVLYVARSLSRARVNRSLR